MVIRPYTDKIMPQYLYYFLSSDYIIKYLQLLAETRSGTFPQITFSEIASIDIKLPNLKTQENIVKIIENIDNKIKINKKINNNKLNFLT